MLLMDDKLTTIGGFEEHFLVNEAIREGLKNYIINWEGCAFQFGSKYFNKLWN